MRAVRPRRGAALRKAQERHDEARAHRRVVLRLDDAELAAIAALAHAGETAQATLRRLLADAAAYVRRRPREKPATSRRNPA